MSGPGSRNAEGLLTFERRAMQQPSIATGAGRCRGGDWLQGDLWVVRVVSWIAASIALLGAIG